VLYHLKSSYFQDSRACEFWMNPHLSKTRGHKSG